MLFARHVDEVTFDGMDDGNLVQRLANLCKKQDLDGLDFTPVRDTEYDEIMDSFYFSKAFDYVWQKIQDLNKEIDEKKPWELNKFPEKHDELVTILTDLVTKLLEASYLLEPFLPETATSIKEVFTAEKILPPATPLFPKN